MPADEVKSIALRSKVCELQDKCRTKRVKFLNNTIMSFASGAKPPVAT